MKFIASIILIAAGLGIISQIHAAGKGNDLTHPDFTKGDKIPAGASHDWNLGPTGARGWIYSHKMETSEARQISVTQVAKGSPADGALRQGDAILGIAGKQFQYDPRTEMGKAISAAEMRDGQLVLTVWRDGKTSKVTVQLPVLGEYSPTAPFKCQKSKKIFEQGCKVLAAKMKSNPKAGNGITRSLNALALLASGKDEYIPLIQEQVALAAKYSDVEGKSLHAWFYGPANTLVAEYILATGDRTYLPDLKRISMEIVRGQSPVGSWGHRFVREDGRLGGYGMMNAPGIQLTTSLILARAAGVNDPVLDQAIAKSQLLLRFYVGKGSIPYGDHSPWIQTHDDNGKNGNAAIMFNLLGDSEAAEYFSKMSVASHGSERDSGHTGNFLNMLWAMPGVALSGPHASGAWMREFGWYYDLTRRWDGTFQHQGPPAARPDSYRNWDCTGAYLLAYAQPLKEIYLTGKRQGIVKPASQEVAAQLVEYGRGWSTKIKNTAYAKRSDKELLALLESWSPVVRDRAAMEMGKRKKVSVAKLIKLLESGDLHTQLGACQAMIMMKGASSPAVPALRKKLKANDVWLRIKAAEALTAIGPAAKQAVPELLSMLTHVDSQKDPRGMQQRYLTFALFDRGAGLLKGSIKGIDRKALYSAVRAGLVNQDGRARSSMASVFRMLEFDEIKPLLPAIHEAVVEQAPSGIMFASGIRLSGLEVLAKHRIKEGVPLCLDVMAIDKWGKKSRIDRCLKTMQIYRGAARPLLPRLRELEKDLTSHRESKALQQQIKLLQQTISIIESDKTPPKLQSIRG